MSNALVVREQEALTSVAEGNMTSVFFHAEGMSMTRWKHSSLFGFWTAAPMWFSYSMKINTQTDHFKDKLYLSEPSKNYTIY